MNHLLNILGVVHNGINDFIMFGIFAIILSRKGIGHKKLLRLAMAYCGWRGLNALSVAIDLYYGGSSFRSACFREIAASIGTACIVYFGIAIVDVITTLVTSETNTLQRDRIVRFLDEEQHAKIEKIDCISKQQNEHLRLLNQGGGA